MVILAVIYYAWCLACFASVYCGIYWMMKKATMRRVFVCVGVAALTAAMVHMWFHAPLFKGLPYAVVCLIFIPCAEYITGRKKE